MKNQKKIWVLGLSLALLFSLGGCKPAPAEETPPPSSVQPTAVPDVETPEPGFSSHRMRIALCTSPGTVDDQASNTASYEGALSFLISRGSIDALTPIQETTGDSSSALQAISGMADNYDVLICVGPAFSRAAEIARANPEKYVILVDVPLPEGETLPENAYSLNFAEQECGFLAGIAAALSSQTGRVAVINSIPTPVNTRYYYGFRSGVAYTNGNFGTAAEVVELPEYAATAADGTPLEGSYTGSLTDTSAGYSLAQDLIGQGCDVLFVAADGSGKGAYTAAKEHENVWIIGAGADQFSNGERENGNVVLTSVTKNTLQNLEAVLRSIAEGTFQGGSVTLRSDTWSVGYVSTDDHQQMSDDVLAALAQCYPLLQDGTLVPRTGPATE